jgi:hypothetical protein
MLDINFDFCQLPNGYCSQLLICHFIIYPRVQTLVLATSADPRCRATQVPDHLVHLHNIGILSELPFLVSVFIFEEAEPCHENVLDIFQTIERPQKFFVAFICWLSLREKFLAYWWILPRIKIVQLSHFT